MLENLKKYFKKETTPQEISDYILGNISNLNYNDYFYYWEDITEKTIKETGIESEYTSRALTALYKKDYWRFSEVASKFFDKNKKDIELLINLMKTEIKLKLTDIGNIFYASYYENSSFLNVFSRVIYEEDKDVLKDILVTLDVNYYPKLISFMSRVNYDYYEIDIKNHLNQNLLLGDSLYESLQYIKNDEDYKEAFVLRIMDTWMNDKGASTVFKDSLIKFIETSEKDKNFEKAVKKMDKKKKTYDYHRFSTIFFPVNLKNMTEFEKRVFQLSLDIDLYESMKKIFSSEKRTYKYAVEYIEAYDLTYTQVLEYFFNEYFTDTQFKKFIENDEESTLNALKNIPNSLQSSALSYLYKVNKDLAYNYIWDIMENAKSGGLKLDIVNYLFKYKAQKTEIKEKMIELLKSKKINLREIALNYIIKTYDNKDESLLKEFLNKEKSDKIKKIVVDFFVKKKISFSSNSDGNPNAKEQEELVLFSKEWFIFNAKKSKKKNLGWLDINSMPKLHYKDNGEVIGDKELYYFINIASSEKKVIPSEQIKKFGELIKDEDLKLFAKSMYESWNREAKTKWALAFTAAFGDDELVKPLKNEILRFVDYGRGAVAAQMVEAIAMIGTTKAFQTVDYFTKKVRHKQVKRAANEALLTAAKELNITKEELLDKIIPNFGFNEEGIINLDFGARQFEVKLTPDLAFLITDNNGKTYKNLPKVGKNDDAVKGGEASKFFKELKKEVKTQVKLQKNRLENGFSANRLWKFENWKELFIKNPMMKQFALTLIWGIYDEKGLKSGFRFLEDGSFSDIEDEVFNIKNNDLVGLVHPIELTAEKLEQWKEVLDDYEITQSFEQLSRPVYEAGNKKDDLKIDDFIGFVMYKSSLKNKLFNKGWERGSVQDAGCYYEYYKDFDHYGISVELNFGGDCMYEDGETIIKEIVFYKSGTVSHGSYVYDKPAEGNTFSLKQIPKRLYSEIYHEIKTIAESGKGFDPKWETKDWW